MLLALKCFRTPLPAVTVMTSNVRASAFLAAYKKFQLVEKQFKNIVICTSLYK